MAKEKLYTEELSITDCRFWNLVLQKLVRTVISLKFILFQEVMYECLKLVNKNKMTGTVFATSVVTSLITLAVGNVVVDLGIQFLDVKKDDKKEKFKKRYRGINKNDEDLYENE